MNNQPNQDEELILRKKINLMGRGLILAWNTWNKDTAEHEQARDKIIDDFTNDLISAIKQWAIKQKEDNSGLYDKAFIEHIQSHLKNGEEVICKICGKSAREICIENCKCKKFGGFHIPIRGLVICDICNKPVRTPYKE